jgi:lauroyl/myristoyl acyltransferase
MTTELGQRIRSIKWWLLKRAHTFDFKYILPIISQLPLTLAYACSALRGKINAAIGKDWRSVALGHKHIRKQSMEGYGQMPLLVSKAVRSAWTKERFEVEAREEFEAWLIAARRVQELNCNCKTHPGDTSSPGRKRGQVLLTLHFDSFFMGAAFLAKSGEAINFMSSSITHDPRVHSSVQSHFETKYRGIEHYLNGGRVIDMEEGMRSFYRMLERNETLIILGDAPAVAMAPAIDVNFLGRNRRLAAGALRLAQRTGSDLGAYLCMHRGGGKYELVTLPARSADDPQTITQIYDFFSAAILEKPGRWWAVDLLPAMPPTD